MGPLEYVDINVGRITREELANIVREVRSLWRNLDNVYPGGDRQAKANIKATLDRYGQYHIWLNHQALVFVMLFCKDIPKQTLVKQSTAPPMPADFLLPHEGSTPEPK